MTTDYCMIDHIDSYLIKSTLMIKHSKHISIIPITIHNQSMIITKINLAGEQFNPTQLKY